MKQYDFIFLHPVTHIKVPNDPTNDSVTYTIMPQGTMALADLLDREGYETRIFHTGIEYMSNINFDIKNLLKQYEASVVGIDLHWYVHSYDAIRIASIVKKNSNSFVVLGGFTASFFAEEILLNFDCIDAIICGDAEKPLHMLTKEIVKNSPNVGLEGIPNLVYRNNSTIQKNHNKYVADVSDLDSLSFTNFSLLSNFDKYHKTITQFGDLDPSLIQDSIKTHAWLCIGRGCSVNCSYCGGGNNAFKILTGRKTPIFRSKEKVVETLAKMEEIGISSVYMDFDPFPEKRQYHHDLFEAIRKEKIDISAQFLLWTLSTKDFLKDFKRTFNPLFSTVSISPESGSEKVRKMNKGFYYTNKDLFRWLDHLKQEMIPVQVYFASGLTGETHRNFQETIKLGENISQNYPVVSVTCNPIEMEPASLRFLSPKKYGVRLKVKNFLDYYNLFKGLAEGNPISTQLGYSTKHLTEQQIKIQSLQFAKTISSRQSEIWQRRYFGG